MSISKTSRPGNQRRLNLTVYEHFMKPMTPWEKRGALGEVPSEYAANFPTLVYLQQSAHSNYPYK